MNIGEIINSGILMDYCLGLLPEEEKNKVEQVAREYQEIATELKLLQSGLERYAVKKTTWNKEALKHKIWDAIDEMNKSDKNNKR